MQRCIDLGLNLQQKVAKYSALCEKGEKNEKVNCIDDFRIIFAWVVNDWGTCKLGG
jgi:hypothetical protein